mgnify:CR=1 FL=1
MKRVLVFLYMLALVFTSTYAQEAEAHLKFKGIAITGRIENVVEKLKAEIEKAKTTYDNIQRFMAIVKKYSDFDELTPEILRAYIDKVYIYEKQKVDGHYTHTVEIIYNLVGAIDLPDFGDLLDEEN